MKQFCIALLSFVLASAAHASPVTYSFTGTVTDDPYGLSSPGAAIAGSFVFDSSAVDAIASPSTGSFLSSGAAYGFNVDVGGHLYAVAGGVVVNTANDIGVDQYGVVAQDSSLDLELFFQDATSSALSSDALPTSVPSIAAFDFRQFRLFSGDAEFLGSVDSLSCTAGCTVAAVPEPGTALLLGPSLFALVLTSRIRARRPQHSSTT
jgi:hypothetical protein